MRLFLSWSKSASHSLAQVLAEWIPQVIQEVEPWISSEIDKGQRWAAELGAGLSTINQGILCVTPENISEPWLNYEAGALAKTLDESRVRPVLLNLKPSQLTGPLVQFQATIATEKDDMLKLIKSINLGCDKPLVANVLEPAFTRVWDETFEKIRAIDTESHSSSLVRREPDDMIAEILDRVRDLQRSATITTGPTLQISDIEVPTRHETFARWIKPVQSGGPVVDNRGEPLLIGQTVVHSELGFGKVQKISTSITQNGHRGVYVWFPTGQRSVFANEITVVMDEPSDL